MPYTFDSGAQRRIKLENLCWKLVDEYPEQPCFHYSPLDCFREGQVMTPGGADNRKNWYRAMVH
eukprot:scaffold952_cov409-Prasinococcus_capsulatus_cf.AAC.64